MLTSGSLRIQTPDKPADYPIYFEHSFEVRLAAEINRLSPSKVIFVTNTVVAGLFRDRIDRHIGYSTEWLMLPDHESAKNLDFIESMTGDLLALKADRQALLIALGGGVVGDFTGFLAAVYMRGIRWIAIPTTLLAMVDSSVGGKVAVNHPRGKNLIGAFYHPESVLIDSTCLDSLPLTQRRSGLGEVIKYAFIRDAEMLTELIRYSDVVDVFAHPDQLSDIIMRCVQIKADVVAADEREHGLRAILNFGHTYGHAIEHVLGYGNISHGEAVIAGMMMALTASQLIGYRIDNHQIDWLKSQLGDIQLPSDVDAMMTAMESDKKRIQGRIRLIVLERPGVPVIRSDVPANVIRQSIEMCLA